MQRIIEEKHQLKNIKTIYNPVDVPFIKAEASKKIDLDVDFIIGAGQYNTNIKQFDILIEAYAKSILPIRNIALVILGTGKLKNRLLEIINDHKLNHMVFLQGFESNPYKYIAKAKFFVLTSKFEGFPMVLIESLASGTPVIAFNCPTGPEEIIQNKINGLLVENQNMDKLIQAMNLMITNDELYLRCKMNAKNSIEKFSLSVIGKQWMALMNYN
jgi:N-acetylgalactosamine-N,N'-diacetylbacillosaminyl-diphospho-undecaprenol 4-alpha-N-acetylgalactosaminyltransferase